MTAAARQLDIAPSTLLRWLNDGFVAGEQITPGAPCTTVQVSRSVTGLSLRVMACRQGMATSSYLLSGRRCLSGVSDGLESCAVVVPSGSGLVESSA